MQNIVVDNLTKRFGSKTAVDSLQFTIQQGELFGLLGLNGAGKTTTIKLLSCLLRPTSGDATVLGHSITTEPQTVRSMVNVSPQESAFASKLSVRENLELIAAIYGDSKVVARQKAGQLVDDFEFGDYANYRAKNLSGGWQRRLSVAMALVTEPQVLFLDEPTLGLDIRARRELWSVIQKLKGKVTIILTTHYLEEAEALADRVCILDLGKVRALGTPREIIAASGKPNFEEAFLAYTPGSVDAGEGTGTGLREGGQT